jgi:hypothetical protein
MVRQPSGAAMPGGRGAGGRGDLAGWAGGDEVTRCGQASYERGEVLAGGLRNVAAYQREQRSRSAAAGAVDAERRPDGAADAEPRRR